MAARALTELADQVQHDEALAAELKTDPEAALRRAAGAYTEDKTFYRIAIAGLVGIIILIVVAAVVIQFDNQVLPDWIAALATTALGGLVGLFAQSPVGD